MAVSSSKKRKTKISKNKKKSWNKVCDVKDVEEFLEDKRLEERIGSQAEKTNEELFFIQTGTQEPAEAKKVAKTLKCHALLGSYTNVPPPVNIHVNRYPKRIKSSLQKAADKRLKKLVTSSNQEKNLKSNENETLKDLWAEDEEVDEEIKDLVAYRDEITKKKNPNVPCHRFQKPSLLPAVEVPHAGASYNPAYEDHQELVRKAVDVEENHLKDELHLKRVLDDMFPSKDEAPTEKSILEEMAQGLFEEEDSEEDNKETDTYNQYLLRNPPVLADDRLPKSRKRKRKELKEEARKRAVEKLNRQRLHEIYRIPSIKSELRKEQEESKKKQEKRCERKVEKMYNPKTLSAHKYEHPDIEVNLTEEITGNMRTLKAEGNLLEDRYKSLQRRNLIEPRIKQKMKRKYKLKVQVKRSHRNFE